MAAKTDMDRLGLFSEMPYLLGDKYNPKNPQSGFNTAATKGKQMLPGHSKSKAATRDGYFSDFGRVFDKEAYSDIIALRRRDKLLNSKKIIGKAWVPSSYPKKPEGLGNHFGTLNGPNAHFSGLSRAAKSRTAPPRNFTTNPGKEGTGYGYPDVTIGKLPGYSSDPLERAHVMHVKEQEAAKKRLKGGAFKLNMHPREFFDENPFKSDKPLGPPKKEHSNKGGEKPFRPSHPGKHSGGGKFGTFDPYPDHPKDIYPVYQPNVFRQSKPGEKVFVPSAGPKTYVISSVLDTMVTKTINSTNYNYVESAY